MPIEIKLPELGENLVGGDVVDVKVAAGDTVSAGQTLLEVEAEKSTVEVPAPVAGKIAKLMVTKGQAIKVGQPLFLIEEGGSGGEKPVAKESAAPAKTAPSEEKPRESPPATPAAETPAPAAKPEPPSAGNNGASQVAPAQTPAAAGTGKAVPAGPATRRLARELGIDISQVAPTGKNGRVTEIDVKNYVKELASGARTSSRGGVLAAPAMPDFAKWGPVERQPLEGIRKKTAEQMSLAWSLIPHVTQHDLADITELEAFRKQQDTKTTRLTVTAFALKAAAVALQQFPQFNSSLDMAGGQLIQKRYYHLGVAVDTDRGLLVPVFRDVDKKSVQELAQELGVVAEKARQKKIGLEDMRGGTFTITNLGGIGGTSFTPIVNWPEVAILGISRGRLQPVYRDGQLMPRLLLPLSLSYDHRVIDGADAARFTRRIAEMLENPLLMLLHA
jgi:pyruvate dehydrogenase E2 component (dihydrolipoamide acetyltransferase)